MSKNLNSLKELVDELLEGKHDSFNAIQTEMNVSSFPYLFAIEQAIEQRNFDGLLMLFKDSVPLHPKLMPFVGDAIKTLLTGKKSGKPKIFTSAQGQILREDIHRRTLARKDIANPNEKGMSKNKAIELEAEKLGVDSQTIRRELKMLNTPQK